MIIENFHTAAKISILKFPFAIRHPRLRSPENGGNQMQPHEYDTPKISVSPAEAAKLAGIGRTKLYEAIADGSLLSFRIGTRRLIRITALDAWLASHEQPDTTK